METDLDACISLYATADGKVERTADLDACISLYATADGEAVTGSCMSALPASSLPAAAANRSAASRTVEEPFDDDHWVLDTHSFRYVPFNYSINSYQTE